MKYRFCLTWFLLFAGLAGLQAQKGFKIGPRVGFLSSRPYVTDSLPDEYNFRFKSGFNAGVSMQYGFSERFVLAATPQYVNKGYRIFNDSNSNGNMLRKNAGHFVLPLDMYFKFRMGQSSRLRFMLGAAMNFQMGSTERVVSNDNETFVIREREGSKMYPMLNLGLEIANEDKAGNMFIFGAYYSQSFSDQTLLDIYNSGKSVNKIFSLGYRGTVIGIGLTYLFDAKNFKREEVFFY